MNTRKLAIVNGSSNWASNSFFYAAAYWQTGLYGMIFNFISSVGGLISGLINTSNVLWRIYRMGIGT